MHRIVQQALLGRALLGHVEECPDAAHHLAVAAEHRARPKVEPAIMTVLRTQAEILRNTPLALLDRGVESRLETVAVARMQDFQPVARRPFQGSPAKPEEVLRFGRGKARALVLGHHPRDAQ